MAKQSYRIDSFFNGWLVTSYTDLVRGEIGAYTTLAEALDAIREHDKEPQ